MEEKKSKWAAKFPIIANLFSNTKNSSSSLNVKKSNSTTTKDVPAAPPPSNLENCPVEREELGRNTWCFLHTMAAYIPDVPTNEEKKQIADMMQSLSKFYPCEVCSAEMTRRIKKHPPKINTRQEFCRWMCETHNDVNERLGKPAFDCSKVDERWRDGWKDGRCD